MPMATRSVIVTDDDEMLREVLAEIFRECGWQVRTAKNGFEALTKIRLQVPDLLVSDLEMEGMSGFELLSVVRRRFPQIQVIAMSGRYSGTSIPYRVAADAFYAKAGSSVASLLELASWAISNVGDSLRNIPVPIWVPRSALCEDKRSIAVCCPECMRAFDVDVDAVLSEGDVRCTHCGSAAPLALAGDQPAACSNTFPSSQAVFGQHIHPIDSFLTSGI